MSERLRPGLDAEGRRFLDGAVPAEVVARVGGGGRARDPLRVYVGLGSAVSVAARVELAVAELERLGAFERRRVVVGSPTGLGWLNPTAVEAEELMSGGEVATVVVQYADRRSWRSRRRVPVGRETHRALLEALAERSEAFELAVYAESLGAWASLSAFSGPEDLDRLKVGRGLWVGVPFDGARHRERLAPDDLPARDARFGLFAAGAELEHLSEARRRALRFTFLTRPGDPVATFEGARVLVAPPRRRAPGEHWVPVLSAIRSLRHIVRATDFRPGHLDAAGHDYRGELAAAVRVAFGHDHLTPEGRRAVEAELLARERRRAGLGERSRA